MSNDPSQAPRRLHGWFWVVLFAPATFCATGTTLIELQQDLGLQALGPLFIANLGGGLLLNLICSAFAARNLTKARSSDSSDQKGAFGWFVVLFGTNLVLSFVGCTLGGALGRQLQ